MNSHDDTHASHQHNGGARPARFWITLAGFLLIAVILLWEEHSMHILGAMPWLLLLACLLLHIFMHGGHGHGGHQPRDKED